MGTSFHSPSRGIRGPSNNLFALRHLHLDTVAFETNTDTEDDHRDSIATNVRRLFGIYATESIENAILNIRYD